MIKVVLTINRETMDCNMNTNGINQNDVEDLILLYNIFMASAEQMMTLIKGDKDEPIN